MAVCVCKAGRGDGKSSMLALCANESQLFYGFLCTISVLVDKTVIFFLTQLNFIKVLQKRPQLWSLLT